MANTTTMIVGPLTSAPASFASQSAQVTGDILRQFATAQNGLGLAETATNQEVINACNEFAARRFHNYVKNWYHNRQVEEAQQQIRAGDPLNAAP